MANIVIPFAAVSHAPVPSVGFNNNFTEVAQKFNTYAVQTDVAKVINAAHTWNAAQTWTVAQSFAGLTLTGDVLFTDGLYDIGKTGLTRPRDGFFSRNVVVGGTLNVTGAVVMGGTLNVTGVVTGSSFVGNTAAASLTGAALPAGITGSSLTSIGTLGVDLLFTDALFDIGKTGATRPRDGFFSRNLVAGGAITAGGAVAGTGFAVGGQQVVGARAAGWVTQTGAQTRADMGATPTLATVASTLDALVMDLRAHGLI